MQPFSVISLAIYAISLAFLNVLLYYVLGTNEKPTEGNPAENADRDPQDRKDAMKTEDLIDRSIYIITEYYKNNLEPFFENISDDILWIGPAERQQIQGRENVIRIWKAEKHALTFTLGDIKARCVSPHSRVKEILLHYDIYTHYPSGNTYVHNQWIHYTWREKRVRTVSGWDSRQEIVLLHISNWQENSSQDMVYPVHYEHTSAAALPPARPGRYVTVKASDMSVHRTAADHILYFETVKHSARLQMHTTDGVVLLRETLPGLEKKYPGLFLRVHASYLLNPAHVREIRRFFVTLSDGTALPIPEKNYTRIKRMILQENAEEPGGAPQPPSPQTHSPQPHSTQTHSP